jgi:hypothetical protein
MSYNRSHALHEDVLDDPKILLHKIAYMNELVLNETTLIYYERLLFCFSQIIMVMVILESRC